MRRAGTADYVIATAGSCDGLAYCEAAVLQTDLHLTSQLGEWPRHLKYSMGPGPGINDVVGTPWTCHHPF